MSLYLRSLIAQYDLLGRENQAPSSCEAYRALMAQKEAALAGWIGWVALQDPSHSFLSLDSIRVMFGEYVNRLPTVERRGETWALIG